MWIFSAVEHWNGECVGIHVAKKGDRFAALEPVAQGLTRLYGAVTAEVARGLSLRMDHGTQYLADDFQHQIQHWGITPSFAFVQQPQTKGYASHCTSFVGFGAISAKRRRFESLRPWVLAGGSSPGCS